MNTDDFTYIVKENQRLRNILEAYDSSGGLGEILALVKTWIEAWERRVEKAEARAERAETRPNLGISTTRELLNELSVRVEVDGSARYRTWDGVRSDTEGLWDTLALEETNLQQELTAKKAQIACRGSDDS